jgi:hypothetical protein
MAEEKITIDIEANVAPTIANLKALKKQLRETAAGSDDFKRISQQIRDMDDAIKDANATSDDFAGYLENASGPLGQLGKGLRAAEKNFSSLNAAFKASVIGIVVSLIGGLVAALSKSEETMKKFEPIIIMFEQALNGILGALQPLIDGFIQLALNVMPIVTNVFKVAYSAVTALFQSLGKLGGAVVKLFKGDFKGAWEDAKASVTSFSDNYDAAVDRFEVGTKKITKTQKENLKQQNEDAKKSFEERLKLLEAQDKLDEAKLKKLKEEALALAQTEQEKLDVEKRFAELSYKARIKDLDDKMALYKKDSVEYKNLQTEKINAEAEYISQTVSFAEKQKAIDENTLKEKKAFEEKAKEIRDNAIKDETDKALQQRQTKYQKDLAELEADKQFILKSETEKNELRKALQQGLENDLDKIKTDARSKELASQLLLDEARLKALQENSWEYFDQQRVIENDAYEAQKLKARDNATELEAIETTHKANLRNIDRAEFEAKKDLQLQIVNLYGGFGRALQELAGKNKKLAIAGLLIEQAAGVASIIINTQKAAAKAGYITPLGIATLVAGAASVAAAVVATVKGIQQINAVNVPGASGGGGSSSGGASSIQAPTVPSAAAPVIETTAGANPSAQIAETIGRAQSPVRAYVVSQDISSQQALDRRTNRAATFVGG